MLHIRYDWRRPVFMAAICLTFFLSSQTNSPVNRNEHSTELVKENARELSIGLNAAEKRLYESSFSINFYIAEK